MSLRPPAGSSALETPETPETPERRATKQVLRKQVAPNALKVLAVFFAIFGGTILIAMCGVLMLLGVLLVLKSFG